MASPRRSKRTPKQREHFSDEQAAAAAATAPPAKKPKRSTRRNNENETAPVTEKNDADATVDCNYEMVGEGDDAILIAASIPKGDDYHEAESGSGFEDYEAGRGDLDAERDAAAIRYSLDKYKDEDVKSDDPPDLNTLFMLPTSESYEEPEEKVIFLDLCQKEDGKENKQRCREGRSKLPRYVQKRIGFLGFSNPHVVYAEAKPGSDKWSPVRYCPMLKGAEKYYDKNFSAAPGSLHHTVRGDWSNLVGMKPGDIRPHRMDLNGETLFKVKHLNLTTDSISKIKKEVEANVDIWEAVQKRMAEVVEVRGKSGCGYKPGEEQKFYMVTKQGDKKYGRRGVKSVSDLMFGPKKSRKGTGDIGQYHYPEGTPIREGDLPSKMGKEVKITTKKRGEDACTYIVKRITYEEYKMLV